MSLRILRVALLFGRIAEFGLLIVVVRDRFCGFVIENSFWLKFGLTKYTCARSNAPRTTGAGERLVFLPVWVALASTWRWFYDCWWFPIEMRRFLLCFNLVIAQMDLLFI